MLLRDRLDMVSSTACVLALMAVSFLAVVARDAWRARGRPAASGPVTP
jgi:hypothetical protein